MCKTNPAGVIETDDGATILLDGRGYGVRGPDPSQPHVWRLTTSLQFVTDDERYQWLNTILGVMEGQFDERDESAQHQACAAPKRFDS